LNLFYKVAVAVLLLFTAAGFAQSKTELFLTPSDSLHLQRKNAVIVSQAAGAGLALVGLNELWYADYPRSGFQYINDNAEWLQMDKAGHVFSSFHLANFSKSTLAWSGISKKNQVIYGAAFGLGFLTAVEVMDGYSSNWGASLGDVGANIAGTALFVTQELAWNEQRIIPKFSFHTTPYASARPNVLGSSLREQILKDYNGQTYWLSTNLHSFFKGSKIPTWFNIALGYGAEGMITGQDELVNTIFLPESKRFRQYYLSFDVDLTRIRTKSHVLKTVFEIFNSIKIPAPTFEINSRGDFTFHYFYF
jgi:uncharacterized protein YfiM (DUF2279 family)